MVGSGISGAFIGLRGVQAGHDVTILESSWSFGGLNWCGRFSGQRPGSGHVDRFCHVIVLESDRRLLTLEVSLELSPNGALNLPQAKHRYYPQGSATQRPASAR